ncbi:MAG: ubiquitin-like protein [Acutalibacteraceae bacterium]
MKKRILSIVLSLCMVLMFVPISANAMIIYVNLNITGASTLTLEVESGDSISNVKGKIKDQTGYSETAQILKYNGEVLENARTLADYNIQKKSTIELSIVDSTPEGLTYTISDNEVTITKYSGTATEVEIPSIIDGKTVKTIGTNAFLNCTSLASVTIPSGVKTIGHTAFAGCTSLESIFLPNSLNDTQAGIPNTTSQVKYSLDETTGEVTITEINLAGGKDKVDIPEKICGYPVVAVVKSEQPKVGEHTCKGGTATCTSKAVCVVCGKEYGELDSTNHNLEKISAKYATVTETGNTEYLHCKDCGKYFSDKDGKNSIELKDTVIAKLPPEIIGGLGQSVTEGEKKELTFRSNAAFSDFIRVELNGKTLDEKNYDVKEGSTVVTLKADYVSTLSVGEHTIGIVSTSGTAATTFTVNAKAAVNGDTKSPQTGYNSHMALWIALLFVSGGLMTVTGVYSKKKRSAK